jgi:hypothetical protein
LQFLVPVLLLWPQQQQPFDTELEKGAVLMVTTVALSAAKRSRRVSRSGCCRAFTGITKIAWTGGYSRAAHVLCANMTLQVDVTM